MTLIALLSNLFKSRDRRYIVFLLLITFLSHGLILFMDGIYHDDYLIVSHLSGREFHEIVSWYKEAGYIFGGMAYLHLVIITLFGKYFLFGYRLIAFIIIFLNSLLVFEISKKTRVLSNRLCLLISIVSVAYPAVKIYFLVSEIQYIFCLFIFLLASYIALGKERPSKLKKIIIFSLFIFSFYTESLLSYYFGFLLLLLINRYHKEKDIKYNLLAFTKKNYDFAILPFIYFFVQRLFFPAYGRYISYNQLMIYGTAQLNNIISALISSLNYPIQALIGLNLPPFTGLVFFAAILYLALSRNNKTLLFGLFLLFLGIFPYSAVGKTLMGNFESRHALLINIPLSIIIVCLIELFRYSKKLSTKIHGFIYSILIFIFVLINLNNYIVWQFRWVRDKAIINQLEKLTSAQKYSIFYIIDNTYPPKDKDIFNLTIYEWSTIFRMAWHDQKWIGIEAIRKDTSYISDNKDLYISRFNLADLNPQGSKAILSINYPKNVIITGLKDRLITVIKYYYYKLLNSSKLSIYLNNLVKIDIKPY